MTSKKKPVLIYDGDCNFCRHWVNHFCRVVEDRVDTLPSQEAAHRFPDISAEQFQSSVQLVQPDGSVYAGAEAVFRALAYNPKFRWQLWMYRKVPGVAPVTELLYRLVARYRGGFSRSRNSS